MKEKSKRETNKTAYIFNNGRDTINILQVLKSNVRVLKSKVINQQKLTSEEALEKQILENWMCRSESLEERKKREDASFCRE